MIRDNANMIVVFKQDEMNLRHTYNDHLIGDMSFNKFIDIKKDVGKINMDFLSLVKMMN